MTDQSLFDHIRRLVREQKSQQVLDVKQDNFAEEYCKFQMLKKKKTRNQENRINALFKNFKTVQSYINIMDIVKNLQLDFNKDSPEAYKEAYKEELPQIIPKSLQLKIKEQISPILNRRYEQESAKRQQVIRALRETIPVSNCDFLSKRTQLQQLAKEGKQNQKLQLIDVLRKDIKRKQIYFLQDRFNREMKDLGKAPRKLQDSKLFHKICSYLHMILEQEHKQKWASKQEQQFREERRKGHLRKKVRIPTFIRNYSESILKKTPSKFKQHSSLYRQSRESSFKPRNSQDNHKLAHFEDNAIDSLLADSYESSPKEEGKRLQSKQQLVKQTFTFRKRNVKNGLLSKINGFMEGLHDKENKQVEMSKMYKKALQSLEEFKESSYGKFSRDSVADEQDIQEMKKYLDSTMSRSKKDQKKLHHK